MNTETELKIEKYIGGLMSSTEEKDFEADVRMNDHLRRELAISKELAFFLKFNISSSPNVSEFKKIDETGISEQDKEEIRKNIKEVSNLYFKEQETASKKSQRIIQFVISAAAVALIFIVFEFLNAPTSYNQLYLSYYNQNDLPSFTTRSADENLLSQVEKNFKDGDIDDAFEGLNTYLGFSKEVDPLSYIYSGLIYSEKGNFFEAIKQLEILRNSDSLDAEKATWFQALVYLKFGDKDNVVLLLKDIASNPSNYKYLEALVLLDKL